MHIYIIKAGDEFHKIGITKNPEKRLRGISTGCPFTVSVAYLADPGGLDARTVEQRAHSYLRHCRGNGEWFLCSTDEAIEAIEKAKSAPPPSPVPCLPNPHYRSVIDPDLPGITLLADYPVELEEDEGTIMVSFPDVPGARTYGEDENEALANAVDALETILSAMITDRAEIPAPSPAQGRHVVTPTLLGLLKLTVYSAMRSRNWRKADLARAMGLNPRQIDRLLDLRHASTVAQLDQALAVCGKRAEVEVRELVSA